MAAGSKSRGMNVPIHTRVRVCPRHRGMHHQYLRAEPRLQHCPGHAFVWKDTAYWISVLHLLAFSSGTLPGVSVFFCGTLHTLQIHFENKRMSLLFTYFSRLKVKSCSVMSVFKT